jgi:APA family basic amino acid/polyamine antiporter
MLSFTIAHAAVIGLRYRRRADELAYRARPNLRIGGVDWPVFAVVGGLATAVAWLVIVVEEEATRWAGLGWLAAGFIAYALYRRLWVREPLTAVVRAPALVLGPSLTVEYRTIVVPVVRSAESEEALVAAARLAAERGSKIAVIHVLEVPLDLPLDAPLPEREAAANELLDDAEALVESYGLRVVTRLVRARSAGRAIIDEAAHRDAELVVLGAPRTRLFARGQRAVFGSTVDQVLKGSPARVLVAAGSRAA